MHVNDIQNNPLQPDISFRGYTASPLLGTPQGLSVYADGVRLNQPFGDVVSWDLIPRAAIATLTLMPGSNPLFGLNTLGGALALRTKDGFDDIPALRSHSTTARIDAARSRSKAAAMRTTASIGTERQTHSRKTAGATPRPPMPNKRSSKPAGATG